MNPVILIQFFQRWSLFQEEHPRVVPFFQEIQEKVLKEGSVIEMKATDPDGKSMVMNIRVTANDVETFRMFNELSKKQGDE